MRIKNLGQIFTRVGPLVDYLLCVMGEGREKMPALRSGRLVAIVFRLVVGLVIEYRPGMANIPGPCKAVATRILDFVVLSFFAMYRSILFPQAFCSCWKLRKQAHNLDYHP